MTAVAGAMLRQLLFYVRLQSVKYPQNEYTDQNNSIDKFSQEEYNPKWYGLVAQLGAHHIRIVGVEGSNPFKSTKSRFAYLQTCFFSTKEFSQCA